jgi:very-short-patch-repair endonuclease
MVEQFEFWILFGLIIISGIMTFIRTRDNVDIQQQAQYYRQYCQSSIERKVFDGLVGRGIVPVTQLKIGRYSIDLALPKYGIAVECDGLIWHSSPEAVAKDKRRDAFLASKGWKTLRFTDKEINENPDRVVNLVMYEIKNP